MLDREDLKELQDVFDDRYVRQNDCNDRQEEINKKLSNDDKRLEILHNDMMTFKKIAYVATSTVVAQLVISFLNLFRLG